MTLNQMIEDIQQEYPSYGFTQLTVMLNQAYKEFCRRTGILRKSYVFPAIKNWEDIEFNWEDYTVIASYAIPSDVDEITEVRWLNTDGEYVGFEDTGILGYEFKEGEVKLYYQLSEGFGSNVNPGIQVRETYQDLEIIYKAVPTDLSDATSTTEILGLFDDALIARVRNRLATRAKEPTATLYYSEWKDFIIEGKKKANKQQDGTGFNITNYQYPGQT